MIHAQKRPARAPAVGPPPHLPPDHEAPLPVTRSHKMNPGRVLPAKPETLMKTK